jgi:hypothetical protein
MCKLVIIIKASKLKYNNKQHNNMINNLTNRIFIRLNINITSLSKILRITRPRALKRTKVLSFRAHRASPPLRLNILQKKTTSETLKIRWTIKDILIGTLNLS